MGKSRRQREAKREAKRIARATLPQIGWDWKKISGKMTLRLYPLNHADLDELDSDGWCVWDRKKKEFQIREGKYQFALNGKYDYSECYIKPDENLPGDPVLISGRVFDVVVESDKVLTNYHGEWQIIFGGRAGSSLLPGIRSPIGGTMGKSRRERELRRQAKEIARATLPQIGWDWKKINEKMTLRLYPLNHADLHPYGEAPGAFFDRKKKEYQLGPGRYQFALNGEYDYSESYDEDDYFVKSPKLISGHVFDVIVEKERVLTNFHGQWQIIFGEGEVEAVETKDYQ
tara:strand:+ start:1633 stop:2493 length:861 start_codon:yes stop_codon:yes gene_type:complete